MTQVLTTTETYNLNEEVIEREVYNSNRFTPDDIVDRAKRYAAQHASPTRYDVFRCNCEHLVTEFTQGVGCSSQVISFMDKIPSFISCLFHFVFKIVSRLKHLPGLSIAACALTVVNSIRKLYDIYRFMKNKLACLRCYRKHKRELIIAIVLGSIGLIMSVVSHIYWPVLISSLIISIGLPFVVSLVDKHIVPLILPGFHIPKKNISTQQIPQKGDIVTFNYINLPHEGVVSRVHKLDSDEAGFKATIVHFPWPGITKPYTVMKETLYFKPEDHVYILNFEGVNHFSSDLVVSNALQEVGKQNHSHFTYRSSHLARFCKTGTKRIKKPPKLKVQSYEDLSPGDVIQFKYCGLPHEAVVIQTAMSESVTADVIHYNYNGAFGTRQVVEETFTFNIKDKDTFIHDYTGIEIYDPDEVVRRAESRLGEQKFNTFTNRSSHLAKWCKVKKVPS